MSGLVISWGNGPVNMLGSSLLLGALSGYLSRSDPTIAHAATQEPHPAAPSSQTSLNSAWDNSSAILGQCPGDVGTARSSDVSCCEDLLHCAANLSSAYSPDNGHAHDARPWPNAWRGNGAHAAELVWSAMMPGCKTCKVQVQPDPQPPVALPLLGRGRKEPRGLRASSAARATDVRPKR